LPIAADEPGQSGLAKAWLTKAASRLAPRLAMHRMRRRHGFRMSNSHYVTHHNVVAIEMKVRLRLFSGTPEHPRE
jgi:hypothetical protein